MKALPITVIVVLSHWLIKAQNLPALEPPVNHYKELQKLSVETDPIRSHLDQIIYPLNDGASGKQFVGIQPAYLSENEIALLKTQVSFPPNSSSQTTAELDHLLRWQEKRTEADENRALEIARIGYWPPLEKNSSQYGNVEDLFWECRSVVGSECTSENYPATMHLLAKVTRDARIVEFTVKYHHLRPRPYHLVTKLDPMGRVSNPSFASGHTLWAYTQAFTMSELIPDKRSAFLDLAYEVGESREIMGIHYPSDEEAARILAYKMLELMMNNEDFLNDLAKAKSEWK